MLVEVEDAMARRRARVAQPPTVASALAAILQDQGPGPTSPRVSTPEPTSGGTTSGSPHCCGGDVSEALRGLTEALCENTGTTRQLRQLLQHLLQQLERRQDPVR